MSDAPERIWATGNEDRGVWTKENTINALSKFGLQNEEYTRTDLIQPMIDKAVAEALERAARRVEADRHTIPSDCFCSGRKDGGPTRCFDWMQRNAAHAVRALIPKKGDTHD